MDYIYRGKKKADVPLGFYKKLQRGVRAVEAERERVRREVDRMLAKPKKEHTHAKGEKARAR